MPNAGTVTTSLYSHVWHYSVRLKNILLTQNKCSHLVVAEEAIITAIEPGPDRTIDESLSLEPPLPERPNPSPLPTTKLNRKRVPSYPVAAPWKARRHSPVSLNGLHAVITLR